MCVSVCCSMKFEGTVSFIWLIKMKSNVTRLLTHNRKWSGGEVDERERERNQCHTIKENHLSASVINRCCNGSTNKRLSRCVFQPFVQLIFIAPFLFSRFWKILEEIQGEMSCTDPWKEEFSFTFVCHLIDFSARSFAPSRCRCSSRDFDSVALSICFDFR